MKTVKQLMIRDLKKLGLNFIKKTILTLAFIIPVFIARAATLPPATPRNGEAEKTIRTYFKFPQVLIPHSEIKNQSHQKVEVLFTTDRVGNVNFVLAKTEDPLLKSEVEKQFYKLRLPKITTEVVHSVVLNFKTM